jgi:hypothetical protein
MISPAYFRNTGTVSPHFAAKPWRAYSHVPPFSGAFL